MFTSEEFLKVLDLSQTTTDASQSATDSETDTYQMSPDLFSPDEEDFPIPSTVNHHETSQSFTNAEQNNSSVNPSVLTLARRKLLARLEPTRQSEPNTTLYKDVICTKTDQMFSLCTMTALNQCECALASFKLSKMVSPKRNLEHSKCRLYSVHHWTQKKVKTEQDLSVAEPEVVTELIQVDVQVRASLNATLKPKELVQLDCLATPTDLAGCVAKAEPGPVQTRDQETPPNAQLTLAVKPTSPKIIEEHTIPDNDRRSFLIDNIDIYRNIRRCPLGKYLLHDVPFQHVIVTGVITSKSSTRKSITQLEVDDGTALVNCLFDDLLCLPEHRNNFHKYLESWEHNMRLFRTDAVFDETFHFLREYAKRLFQETPQSDDLNEGDEVTIIGKVYDSKNEGRVIYHKYVLRKVDLASRENCDYVQNQFAKQGRHF